MARNYYAHSMFPYNTGDHHNQQTNQHHGNFMNGSSNDMTYQNYGETNSDHNSQKYFNDQMFNYNNSNNNSFFSSSNQNNDQFWNKRGHNYNSNLNNKDDQQSGFYNRNEQSINKSSGLNQMSIDKTKLSNSDKQSSLANKNAKQQTTASAKTMSWASIASQPAKAQPKSFKSKLATVVLSTSTTKHVPPPMPPVAQISLDEIEPIPNPWSKPNNQKSNIKDEPNNELNNNPPLNTSRNSENLRKPLDGTGNRDYRDYNAQHNQPNHRSYASRQDNEQRFNDQQNRPPPQQQPYNRFENNNNQNNRFDNRNENRFNNQNNRNNGLNSSHNSYGSRNENVRDNNYQSRDNNYQPPPPTQQQNYNQNYNQRSNYNNQNYNNNNQNNYYNNKYPNQRPNQYQHPPQNNQYNQNRNPQQQNNNNNRFGGPGNGNGGHMHQQNKNQLPPPQFANKQPPPPQQPPTSTQLTEYQIQQEKEAQALLEKLTLENNYNPSKFDLNPKNAKYFIIKSYSEDDIHRSIKYSIWCSTEHGNIKLDNAFREQGNIGPIYLFYSVNGSGHFCGIAQMVSPVDYNSSSSVWCQNKWKGQFRVKWIYVKDVPNMELRHIVLENNDFKPVTNSRDTQEVPPEKGKAVLKVIHNHKHKTSIFDDFFHYERKQNEELGGRRMNDSPLPSSSSNQSSSNTYKNNQFNKPQHQNENKREQSPSDSSHNLNNSNNSKTSLLSSNYETSNIKKSWAEQCD